MMLKYLVISLFTLLMVSCGGRSGGSHYSESSSSSSDSCAIDLTLIDDDSYLTEHDESTPATSTSAAPRASSTGALDWLLFRGDQSMSGYTNVSLPSNPALLWTFKSDSRSSSSPVVDNGVTYWSDRRGHIRGVNLNGEQIFSYDFQTAIEASPMIHNSVLYIGRIDGTMTAISLSQKDTLWNYETMGQLNASASYMNFEGRQAVVFGSYDNFLYCLDSKTGEVINSFESGYYIHGAVALWKNHVIFGGCDAWVRIINCHTGIATDSLLLDSYIPASPAIIGDFCYIGDDSGNIYEIRLDNGKIAGHKKLDAPIAENASSNSVPAVTAESLYILTSDQHLYSINRSNGSINWKYLMKGAAGESSPVVCRDKILVCTKTGVVSIINARTGRLEWEYDTGEQILASPAVIRDRFFILTGRGTLFCFGNK